ncbi:hypothetical protein JYU34_012658 [Plutella xylostella]|uniref:Uncharacterized protein n=1 Tax=Plutella xylostella TaxID=51655 RepID=A0ABQ7QBU9_PLUXY|nr:hypothetical protein JYU34_012658 [Plutella xylostella]
MVKARCCGSARGRDTIHYIKDSSRGKAFQGTCFRNDRTSRKGPAPCAGGAK